MQGFDDMSCVLAKNKCLQSVPRGHSLLPTYPVWWIRVSFGIRIMVRVGVRVMSMVSNLGQIYCQCHCTFTV